MKTNITSIYAWACKGILLLMLFLGFVNRANAVIYTVGTGTTTSTSTGIVPYSTTWEDNRLQYLYLATELNTVGATAGTVLSIAFNITSLGGPNPANVNMKIGTVASGTTTLTSLITAGMTNFYTATTVTPTVGWNTYTLSAPFIWNGTDNIVIEVCRDNSSWTSNYGFQVTNLGAGNTRTFGYYADGVTGCSMTSGNSATSEFTNRPNIQFDIVSSVACSGTPNAGTVAPSVPDSICPNVAFTLSATGLTFGSGMTYQWEQSATGVAGSWVDLVGAVNPSYLVAAGINSATYYRLKSICSGGTPAYSTVKSIAIKSFINCYCTPTYTYGCSGGARINNFVTTGAAANISNLNTECASGALGYSNYTSMVVSGMQTTTFDYSVSITSYSAGVKIWADWNQDGTFDPVTELVGASTNTIPSGGTFTGTATIPATAVVGATRLRVRAVESTTSFDPCNNGSWGETEDYTINVVQITPCTNPPAAGVVSGVDSVCPNIGFILQTTGASLGSGLVYQWQSAPAATGPWTDIAGATTLNYNNTAGITVATHYRLKSVCSGGTPVYSTVKSITIKSFINCYCTPTYTYGCSGGARINNFVTTGAAANISNLNTECASGALGYSNYTSMIVSGMQTTTFGYSVSITSYSAGVKIWADWNQDGVFDPVTELVGASTATIPSGGTFAGTATIPATALVGATRLRVRAVESTTSFDPCNNGSWGETEDYTIQVAQIVPCTNPPAGGSVTGVDSICPSLPFNLQTTGVSLGSGLVYQWQSAPAATGPWTNIAGATTLGYNNAAGITANTYYRLQSVCDNGTPVYSTVKAVSIAAPITCHCIPTYSWGCSGGATINSFSTTNAFVNVSNLNTACPSGATGYSNYFNNTALQITAVQSTSFDVAVHVTGWGGGVKIWADWNQDGVFDPVTELVAASTATISAGSTFNGTVTIPVTSNLGVTKLRVRVVESSTTFDPCNNMSYGETEDYRLLVSPMPDCNNATFPTTATLNSNVSTFCAFGNVTFTISPQMPPASSMEYIWESAPTAAGPWTQVGSTIIPTFTQQGVSATAHYRVRLLCHGTEIRNFGTKLITVTNPGSVTATGADRCGPGTATLTATPTNPAHTLEWYNVFTGGTSLATGTSFTTPVVATTTVYFVQPVGAGLTGCAAQRTPVYVYVRPNPLVQLGNNIDTCINGVATVTLNPGAQPAGSTYLWNNGTTGSTLATSVDGTYSVQVTNSFNCTSSDTISVNFRQNPVIDLYAGGTTLCDGGVMILDAGADGENGGDYYWNTGAVTRTINVTATGTYTVYVTTSEGCSDNQSIDVLVGGNMPAFDGIAVTPTSPNQFSFNVVNPQYVVSYHWDYGDGNTETTQVPTTSHQYYANGNYNVTLTTLSTCGEISDSIRVTLIGLGVNDVDNNLNVKVYPNPTKGESITLETEGDIRINEVSIFNIIGQEVYADRNVKSASNNYQIQLGSHLAPGVYNIRMQTNKGLVNRKMEILK